MLLHKLALRMGRTVGELKHMSTDELAHWFAFDRKSPVGDERFDYLFARLCLVVCQVAGVKKKFGGEFKLDDFVMFKFEKEKTAGEFMREKFGHMVKRKPK